MYLLRVPYLHTTYYVYQKQYALRLESVGTITMESNGIRLEGEKQILKTLLLQGLYSADNS